MEAVKMQQQQSKRRKTPRLASLHTTYESRYHPDRSCAAWRATHCDQAATSPTNCEELDEEQEEEEDASPLRAKPQQELEQPLSRFESNAGSIDDEMSKNKTPLIDHNNRQTTEHRAMRRCKIKIKTANCRLLAFKVFCILYLIRHLVQLHRNAIFSNTNVGTSSSSDPNRKAALFSQDFEYKSLLHNSFRMFSFVEAVEAAAAAAAAADSMLLDRSQHNTVNNNNKHHRLASHTTTRRFDNLLTKEMPVVRTQHGNKRDEEKVARPIDLIKKDLSSHYRTSHHHNHLYNDNSIAHHRPHPKSPPNSSGARSTSTEGNHRKQHHRRSRSHNLMADSSGSYFDPAPSLITGADRPLVATQKGHVRGTTQKLVTGKFVDAFLGIPFAQAPVGQYRFRHPQPINPWKGELDASQMGSSCYQVNDTFFGSGFRGTLVWNANTPLSEDCLFLNIWTPFGVANTTTSSTNTDAIDSGGGGSNTNSNVQSSAQNDYDQRYQQQRSTTSSASMSQQQQQQPKRPVLVWIFGGGFFSGTSSLALYEGGILASEEDIIVVSMNYRVSALGFLYFGRPSAPGNSGLFDQLMALQWVNDNISQFGGDPNKVTLFGESAGAVSISFHLLSPLSRNLFQQAILQSGAATCPWGLMSTQEIIQNGLQLASQLNCPANSTDIDAVIECLLKADPMELVSQDVGQTKHILNFPFVPVVDGSFLLETPAESLARHNFKRAQILLGSNYDEGNSWLVYLPEYSHCPAPDQPPKQSLSVSAANQAVLGSGRNNTTSMYQSDRLNSADLDESSDDQVGSFDLVSISGRQPYAPSPPGGQQRPQTPGGSSRQLNSEFGSQQQLHPQSRQQQQQQRSSSGASLTSAGSSTLATKLDQKPCNPIESLTMTRKDFVRSLRDNLNPYAEHPIGKDAIIYEYSNWNNPADTVSNHDAIDKIVGDYYFTCHVNEFAQQYALTGNAVYMYYFKHRSSVSPWPKWMGVIHADEINFIFGEPLNPQFNYTDKEIELSRRMMRYWANFAKYGNPTKPAAENGTDGFDKWPEYGDKRQYFELHADYVRVGRGPRAKQCAFWAHYLPQLLRSFGGCLPNSTSGSLMDIDPFGASAHSSRDVDRQRLFTNLPSFITIGLSVILLAIAVALLFYAKQTGKLHLSHNLSTNNNTSNTGAGADSSAQSGAAQRSSGIE